MVGCFSHVSSLKKNIGRNYNITSLVNVVSWEPCSTNTPATSLAYVKHSPLMLMPRLHSSCELTFWQLKCLLHWNLSHSTALEKWRSHPLYSLLISQFQVDLGFQVKCRPHWEYGHLVRRIWIYRFQVMDFKAQRLEKLEKIDEEKRKEQR